MIDWEAAQLLQAEFILHRIFSMYGDGSLNKRVEEDRIMSAATDSCLPTLL